MAALIALARAATAPTDDQRALIIIDDFTNGRIDLGGLKAALRADQGAMKALNKKLQTFSNALKAAGNNVPLNLVVTGPVPTGSYFGQSGLSMYPNMVPYV